jgi:SAM-dependent methyltransferase
MLGRRQPLVPPRWLSHNSATFQAADETVGLVRDCTGLNAISAVLDLGCGIGRVAYGLTKVSGPDAQYVGIDIVERAIKWMQKEYAPLHPNFKFYHLDVHSSSYNPKGRLQTEEIDFDFLGDRKFDVVILVSLFIHLDPHHVRHYLKLIHSVLKPGGRLFATALSTMSLRRTSTACRRKQVRSSRRGAAASRAMASMRPRTATLNS